jgi:ATP-binding cassette, subfamily C, bacterial LapB
MSDMSDMSDMNIPFDTGRGSSRTRPAADVRLDVQPPDPLLDCLVELTRIHGRPCSPVSLTAGLPLTGVGLTPTLFGRAAARAGLASKVTRKSLSDITDAVLPAVLLLKGDSACVLLGWEEDGSTANILLPETGQGAVSLPRVELERQYAGVLITARPSFRFDRRAPEVANLRERHWFWGAVREQLPLYRDVLGAAFLVNAFALALPLFSMNVYDRVVPNFAVETLWMLALGVAIVMVIDYGLRLMRSHFVDLAGTRIDLRLSTLITERVLGMKLSDRPASVGAFASTLRAFESVRDFVASATVTAVIDLPFALLFLAVIAWIAPPLVLIPLVGMIILIVYSWFVQGRMRALAETTFRASAMRNATLVESLATIETIKAHGAERVMQTRMEESSSFLARTNAQLRLASASVVNAISSLQQFVTLATVVAGVYLIHSGSLTMGGLIAATMLGSRTLGPLSQLVALMMQYQNARTALTSLEGTMRQEPERQAQARYLHRPHVAGGIAFENVHFAYPGRQQEALRGVSLRIQPGEKVVVVGRIGSGKTTLQRLILGLYQPTQGTVLIDGIDLRQLDPAELRRNVGYVDQDATLFYGTLRDNIAVAAPHATDEAIVAAAEIGGLSAFVNRHPQGFDMLIGERGESLSGGQRQGVAIARAALQDPPILLLDEPTGSMDFTSEAQFKQRLRSFGAHKTMLIVTHRTSLLELADRILVLDEGQVVADGPREQVLADLKAGRVGKAA